LEYHRGKWRIYYHTLYENQIVSKQDEPSLNDALNYNSLFNEVIKMN
jgi:hypothetical protein